jgi:hypothetical protein
MDIAFSSSLENFGGGHYDPLFVALGGMSFDLFSHLGTWLYN